MTEAQRIIATIARQLNAAQARLDRGEKSTTVIQALAQQVAALAVAHAPYPDRVVKQVGATASGGVVRVPVVGTLRRDVDLRTVLASVADRERAGQTWIIQEPEWEG